MSERYLVRSAASNMQLEALWKSLNSRFVNRVAHSVSDKGAANRARITNVVPSASDSFELDSWAIVKLYR